MSQPPPQRLLILGGTGDAAQLIAQAATLPGLEIISSLAGRTPKPNIPTVGQVRIGGFGGETGLVNYLQQAQIDLLIDITHPFAHQISWNAANAAQTYGIPHLLVNRPGWTPQPTDRWIEVPSHEAAAATLLNFAQRAFLTIGRQELAAFAHLEQIWCLMRMITPPTAGSAIPHGELLLQQGPFSVSDETALLTKYQIDTIVSKNSGGAATYAKIIAARELGIPVIMIPRPKLPPGEIVETVDQAMVWLRSHRQL
jgi:precorrin-6A/cobalt-precorrin-6A reductase